MADVNVRKDNNSAFDTRLRQLLWRTRLRALANGLIRLGAIGGLMVLVSAWAVGGETGPGGFNGWGLTLSLGLGLAALVWSLVLKPWRALRTPRQLAGRIEREADFANLVVAAEEAGRLPERWPSDNPVVMELKRRLMARAAEVLTLASPADILPLRYRRSSAVVLAVTLILAVILLAGVPREMARGWGRLLQPAVPQLSAATGGLYAGVSPDHVVVGQMVALEALDFAGGIGPAVAEIRRGAGTWQTLPTRRATLTTTTPGLPDPYRLWQAEVKEVREDFVWRFRRGTLVSATRQVAVHHYPLLTTLAARVIPPAYTHLPRRDLERLPSWIEVPAGSRLELTGRVSHPVRRADLLTGANDTLALLVDSLVDSLVVRGSLEIDRDRSFVVTLTDHHDLNNQSPLAYEIAAAADQLPGVNLVRPDNDGILPISGEVDLVLEAADDFGLESLSLLTRTGAAVRRGSEQGEAWLGSAFWTRSGASVSPDSWQEIATAAGILRVRATRLDTEESVLRARFGLELRADGLDLVAGDALELLVEAVDNKEPRPSGRARSLVLRLVLPSASDVLLSQSEANEDRKSELEEMRRRSQQLNLDLDRLTRELMKNPRPDWARQQEMEAAIDRQQKLQQELARVADQLQNELEKLAQSQLASEAQLQKADEMSELLSQSNSDQLSDLLQKMADGGGQASPEDVARAMDEVARNQKEMARRLDAALAMLKRMAQEQELDGLTALLEQMIQKQQELADLSRQLAEQQAEEDQQSDDQSGQEDGEEEEGQDGDQQDGDKQDGEGSEGDNAEGEPQDSDSPAGETPENEAGDESKDQGGEQDTATPTAEELARRQEALEKELEQLQEKLEEALENLREENAAKEENGEKPAESSQDMAEALEKALDQVQQQRQKDDMGKAGQQLEQMDPAEAAKMQEQALRDLGALYSVLLESKQAMQQAMKMEQVGSLRGLAADMLALSARQEEIAQLIPAQLRDLRSLDLTRSQHRLQKAAVGVRAGLGELMAEAPNRIMKLLVQLDGLIETMGEGVQAMEDNRAPVARRHTRESLALTNRLVIGLLTEAQMQGSGSGGGGSSQPQSMSEQLQQMAQDQAGLNGVTEELRRMLADRGISQQARSQMKRLGAEQAEMAAKMGELAEEERGKAEGERLLGDLAEMGRDMESIGREIDDGLVSEETLIRQERILSRMLDARNSVRRRDFTSRRESQAAGRLYADQEGVPQRDQADSNSPFRLKYQPLEQAPMEYRDLVRRYFAALDSLGRRAEVPLPEPLGGDMP